MNLGDLAAFIVLDNPISQALISTASVILKSNELTPNSIQRTNYINIPMTNLTGHHYNFIRLAGLSGALAIFMNLYGEKLIGERIGINDIEAEAIFKRANHYHFLHTVALMAIPMARRPALTGSMLALGTLLFSGPMYYRALTGDKKFIQVATCGGFCLIASWLTLIF